MTADFVSSLTHDLSHVNIDFEGGNREVSYLPPGSKKFSIWRALDTEL